MDVHNVPDRALLSRLMPGYDAQTGSAIALPGHEHARIPRRAALPSGDAQELLERDLTLLESHTNVPTTSLEKLRQLIIDRYLAQVSRLDAES
jgi:hypothetical protein